MLLQEREVTISLVAIVARLFMRGYYSGRYLRSKQLPNADRLRTYDTVLSETGFPLNAAATKCARHCEQGS
jgi:hypothetical protein